RWLRHSSCERRPRNRTLFPKDPRAPRRSRPAARGPAIGEWFLPKAWAFRPASRRADARLHEWVDGHCRAKWVRRSALPDTGKAARRNSATELRRFAIPASTQFQANALHLMNTTNSGTSNMQLHSGLLPRLAA